MRRGVLILVLSGLSAQAGLNKIEAIGMIESGNNDYAIGDAGEISRYQIKPRVWQHYSPSRAYRSVEVSKVVAEQYLTALEDQFRKRAGREPSDFDRYVLWNAGPSYYARIRYSAARVHPIIRERANRFANLCEMKSDEKPRLGPPPRPVPSSGPQPMLAVGGLNSPMP